MTKIAFHLIGDENWHAGFVYLGNLLRALRQNAENEVTLSVMVWDEQSRVPEDLMHVAHEIVGVTDRRWKRTGRNNGSIYRLHPRKHTQRLGT